MALARLNVDVSIPSIGSRPPLLHFGAEIRLTALYTLLGGAIAAAIVWITSGTPVPARPRPQDDEDREVVVPTRFSRAP